MKGVRPPWARPGEVACIQGPIGLKSQGRRVASRLANLYIARIAADSAACSAQPKAWQAWGRRNALLDLRGDCKAFGREGACQGHFQ
jgi:hypothetical protein